MLRTFVSISIDYILWDVFGTATLKRDERLRSSANMPKTLRLFGILFSIKVDLYGMLR